MSGITKNKEQSAMTTSHSPASLLRRHPLATAVALALTATPAGAAVLTVHGNCSLAQAITAANTNTPAGGCKAGNDQHNGGDIIKLAADITLTAVDNLTDGPNGLPSVSSTITINGNGHTLARSSVTGTPKFRLLHVAPEGQLGLSRVTLHNGFVSIGSGIGEYNGGGGLFNLGSATLTHSTISSGGADYGGGIHNEGTLTLIHSRVSNNFGDFGVGGLLNNGSANLIDSTVSGNSGVEASGIGNFDSGTLTLRNSTVSGNDSWYGGSAVWNYGNGGMLTLTNSTISGNDAGLSNGGTATLIHSTISDNITDSMYGGGGLIDGTDVGSTTTLINTLIANNGGSANNGSKDCEGTVIFQGLNLIEDGSCDATAFGQLTGDPHLGALANNGGPTQTQALLAGSPALDQIAFIPGLGCDLTRITADQRGVSRPQPVRGKCDIGAFERIQPAPLNIDVILAFFDRTVAKGNLTGVGHGRSASHRIDALRYLLRAAGNRYKRNHPERACRQLAKALKHIHADPDAAPHRHDFVTGAAAIELSIMVARLRAELSCR